MDSYISIKGETNAEYSEKRSRFIAVLRRTETENEAMEFINEIKLKHRDARHNCYAFSVDGGMTERFSDDGEPHGTAGKPMLDIIKGAGITNVTVVVTRYFGGVLLGTGGLVRAYSAAAKQAVTSAEKIKMTPCTVFSSRCSYSDRERLVKLIEDSGGCVEDTVFGADTVLTYYLDNTDTDIFLKKLQEMFAARIKAETVTEKMRPIGLENEE